MLKKFAGILTVSAICAASAAQAHQVHYAMAAAGAQPVMQPMPDNVFTALAGDAGKAQAAVLAKCRKAQLHRHRQRHTPAQALMHKR